MIHSEAYQSLTYPTLSTLIEIKARDYAKLRSIMLERGEINKFINWQKHKYFKLTGLHFIDNFKPNFNSSRY